MILVALAVALVGGHLKGQRWIAAASAVSSAAALGTALNVVLGARRPPLDTSWRASSR